MAGKSKGDKKSGSKAAETLSAKNAKQVKGGATLSTVGIKQIEWKFAAGDGSVKTNTTRGG